MSKDMTWFTIMSQKVIWFTGLPCSGKTTVADLVAEELHRFNVYPVRLDGDVVRKGLCKELGFSKEDRRKNLERIGYVCEILSNSNVLTLATFVSPYRETRDWLREKVGEENFVEVYCKCSVEECIRRDVKGMYAKALKGEIKGFTGVDDPYEVPQEAEIVLDTEREEPNDSGRRVLERILFKR